MKHYNIRHTITNRDSISINLYFKDIAKYPILTEKEERELIIQASKGDEKAKNKLINSNLRFVITIAKQYQGKGIDLIDLISIGNLGLIEAVNKFNINFNYRFLSYAIWWIRNTILKEIMSNSKIIKIPIEKTVIIHRLNKAIDNFEKINGRLPSDEEIIDILKLSDEDFKNIIDSKITIMNDVIINSDEEKESLCELLPCNEEKKSNELKLSIDKILKYTLNNIEYNIILDFYGLNKESLNINDIAEKYNITKERVRQIKDKAIIKLRNNPNTIKLLEFL